MFASKNVTVSVSASSYEALVMIADRSGQCPDAMFQELVAFWEPHLLDAAATVRSLDQISLQFKAALASHLSVADHFSVGATIESYAAAMQLIFEKLWRARQDHASAAGVLIEAQ